MRKFAIIALCILFISPVGVFASAPPSSSVATAPENAVASAPGPVTDQTWRYLDEHDCGIWGITAYSLGNRPIKDMSRENLDFALRAGIESGFPSAGELALSIIALVKLGENPRYYEKTDLLLPLFSHENIYADGLAGAYYALDAYQSVGGDLPNTARNSPPTLVDYIVSSQQRSGGFAFMPGYEPDVRATANAISALAPYTGLPHVASAIEKALVWLSEQQQNNAAMPADGKASCEATARTLIAIRQLGISVDDPRFVKSSATLEDAVELFKNPDGGYSPVTDTGSDVSVTETVVIALYTNEYGNSPYLSPKNYPGYVPPPPPEPESIFGRFIVGFFIAFGALYLVLILTTKIGKRWGYTPNIRKSGAPVPPSEDTKTLELHIPMKAELPDFSKISDKELFSGYRRSPDKKREQTQKHEQSELDEHDKLNLQSLPDEPDKLCEPEKQSAQSISDEPDKLCEPEKENVQSIPDEPDKLCEPEKQNVQSIPDEPDKLYEPENQNVQSIPDEPDKLCEPEKESVQSIPDERGKPDEPEKPEAQNLQGEQDNPNVPENKNPPE